MEPSTIQENHYPSENPEAVKQVRPVNPLFRFMGAGSLIYAAFFTFCLYKNSSGITYPFFVGGTCFYFFLYLKKSGITAKKFSIFITVSLLLLGLSTCLTSSGILTGLNKLAIFCLFFYLFLHSFYEDKKWDLFKYAGAILTLVCSSFQYLSRPVTDLSACRRASSPEEKKKTAKGKYVLYGILLAVLLLLVLLPLLGSADAVFGKLLQRLFSFQFKPVEDLIPSFLLFLFAFFTSYCILCCLTAHNIQETVKDKKTVEPIVGITFTGIVSFVYLVFCFIQIVYLFGGLGTLPQGYTYASYAREGFFQLVFVCLINLILVLLCVKWFRENKLLKGILTFISFCTYIMIASSAYRMILYIQVYYLTFLRFFVLWALCVIFLLMTGAIVLIYKDDFPFVKYCITIVTCLYLVLSFAHPDYFIARYNLEHSSFTKELSDRQTSDRTAYADFYYLGYLSLDAAPAIFKTAEAYGYTRDNAAPWFQHYIDATFYNSIYTQKISIRNFNFSRWNARRHYAKFYGLEHIL